MKGWLQQAIEDAKRAESMPTADARHGLGMFMASVRTIQARAEELGIQLDNAFLERCVDELEAELAQEGPVEGRLTREKAAL